MNVETAEQVVQRVLGPLKTVFGLTDWHITVAFDRIEDCKYSLSGMILGSCESNPDYEQAWITLDATQISDDADLVRILRHEMLHVVISPMDVYREAITQAILPDSPDDRADHVLWGHFLERTMCALERVVRNLTTPEIVSVLLEAKALGDTRLELMESPTEKTPEPDSTESVPGKRQSKSKPPKRAAKRCKFTFPATSTPRRVRSRHN